MSSFYHLPSAWNPGYAIPKYVMAEPMGRGTFTTKWLPRGTVSTLLPDFVAQPQARKLTGSVIDGMGSLGGGSSLAGSSLAGSSLGGGSSLAGDSLEVYKLMPLGQNGGNPVNAFAQRAAKRILDVAARIPASDRSEYLHRVLDGIDRRLWSEWQSATKAAQSRGLGASQAAQAALAQVLAKGLGREVGELGRRGRPGKQGLMGLGDDGSAADPWDFTNVTRDHRKSSNLFNSPKMQTAFKAAVAKLGNPADKLQMINGKVPFAKFENLSDGGKTWGIYWHNDKGVLEVKPVPPSKPGLFGKVWGFIKSVGKGITQIPKALYTAAKVVVSEVKNLACSTLSSDAGKLAAAGAATAAGAPPQVGAAGAQVASGMCGGDPTPPPLPPPAPSSSGWVLPVVLVGGAAVLAAIALK